jgi:flagellar motility protein MotE (MotC chaperone)
MTPQEKEKLEKLAEEYVKNNFFFQHSLSCAGALTGYKDGYLARDAEQLERESKAIEAFLNYLFDRNHNPSGWEAFELLKEHKECAK